MSVQTSNNFNKAVASPYATSLADLLNLIYNDAQLQIQNREVERELADAQGKSAKAEGRAQEAAGKEQAKKETYDGWSQVALAGGQIGTVASPFLANKLAKSQRFSARGEEIKTLDTKIENRNSWDEPFQRAEGSGLRSGNGALGQQSAETVDLDGLRSKFKEGKAFSPEDQDALDVARTTKQAEFKSFKEEVQAKKGELETAKQKSVADAGQHHFLQAMYIMQGLGQAAQGFLNQQGATHTAAAAEQQNLRAQMDYASKRFDAAQQSLERQSTDLDSAKQTLSQLLGNIARVSNAA